MILSLWSLDLGTLDSILLCQSPKTSRPKVLFLVSLKQQRRIRPAKSKTVRKRVINLPRRGFVRDVVEIAFRIGIHIVNRRRQDLSDEWPAPKRLPSIPPAAPKQMTGHRFGGTDRHLVRVLTERFLDGQRLELVVVRRRGSMRVDIPTCSGSTPASFSVLLHHANGSGTSFVRHRHMKRIAGHAVANNFGVDSRATFLGELQLFENHNARRLRRSQIHPGPVQTAATHAADRRCA